MHLSVALHAMGGRRQDWALSVHALVNHLFIGSAYGQAWTHYNLSLIVGQKTKSCTCIGPEQNSLDLPYAEALPQNARCRNQMH